MGISSREIGLLKLVHPGRHVEVFREPVPAAEVMEKYPRHCIARPDVFKFPWVVVKPEAVLLPGKVFYIVPYRTIYKLLKDRRQKNQHTPRHDNSQSESNVLRQPDLSSDNYFATDNLLKARYLHKENQPLNDQENRQANTQNSALKKDKQLRIGSLEIDQNHSFECQATPLRSSAGRTPKRIHGDSQNSLWYRSRNEEDLSQSVEMPVVSNKKRNGYQNASSDDRSFDRSSSFSGRNRYPASKNRVHEADNRTRGSTSKQVRLKSCLKKPGSARRLLYQRVTFDSSVFIPNREKESPTLQHDHISEL